MCEFKKEVKDKTQFIGYKVAILNPATGKYYSPITGIEYKPGLIETPKVQSTFFNFEQVLDLRSDCHIPLYKGMTAVFKNMEDLKNETCLTLLSRTHCRFLFPDYKIVILKMTIQKTKNKNCRRNQK